jgi:hypothetical protein
MTPFLFLIALIRCSVRLIPARLSAPKSPAYIRHHSNQSNRQKKIESVQGKRGGLSWTCEVAWRRSSKDMGRWERRKSPEGKRASGGRPRSMTTSTSAGSSGWSSTRRRSSPGRSSSSLLSSSSDSSGHVAVPASPCAARRQYPPRRRDRGRDLAGKKREGERPVQGRRLGGRMERRGRSAGGGGMVPQPGEHEWRETSLREILSN